MTEQVTITNSSYKIVDWEKALMQKCIEDNPSFTRKELAQYLGTTERTLYRKFQEYKLKTLSDKEKQVILEKWKLKNKNQ